MAVGWLLSAVITPATMGFEHGPVREILIFIPLVAVSFAWGLWGSMRKEGRQGLWGFTYIWAVWLVVLGVPGLAIYFWANWLP